MNETIILYLVAHFACLVKFAFVLNKMQEKYKLNFSFKMYTRLRWLRWVTHYVAVIGLVYLLPGSIEILSREGYTILSVSLESIGAFAIGFLGYDLLALFSTTLSRIKKMISGNRN